MGGQRSEQVFGSAWTLEDPTRDVSGHQAAGDPTRATPEPVEPPRTEITATG